jgi:hypothetical protein
MRLYTIQPLSVYVQLMNDAVYRAQPRRDPEHWLNDEHGPLRAYEWLSEQMQQRGLERPAPDIYPLWAWYHWYGAKRARPDLRCSQLKSWAEKERHVMLTLEVPESEVLLHDYDAWHCALNYWYFGKSREKSAFDRRCKAVGQSYYHEQPLKDAALDKELVQSWEKIFDLPTAVKLLEGRKRDQVVQATFWELRLDQVTEAIEFGCGHPLRVLTLPSESAVLAG